jgi:hypothetical protein
MLDLHFEGLKVPVSKGRKKKTVTRAQQSGAPLVTSADVKPNPAWFLPVMLGLMVLGLVWIVVYYITAGSSRLPVPALGNLNLAVGFLFIIAGFGMTTRWR